MSQTNSTKTIICDIDGCILQQVPNLLALENSQPVILPNVLNKFQEWHEAGHTIVIITARPESCRALTEKQLGGCSICYHHLIMGVSRGQRVLINDLKSSSNEPTALAICIQRNIGLGEVNV